MVVSERESADSETVDIDIVVVGEEFVTRIEWVEFELESQILALSMKQNYLPLMTD